MTTLPWTITFEVAFDTDPADEPGTWTDLSSRVRAAPGITVSYGAGRLVGGGEGSCRLTLDNRDRAIDPTNSSATYNLVPMRHARLKVTAGGTTYDVFRGYVDAWPPVWSVDNNDTVEISLVDAFAWLALQVADLDLAEQLSSARVTALLDAAGWPAGRRDIDTGRVTVEAFAQDSANLLRVMEDTVDAEVGDLFVAPNGDVTFKYRHARFDSTVSATFGPDDIKIGSMAPAWDTSWITNTARVELSDGTVQDYTDAASETAYGKRSLSARDLPLRSAEAEAVAMWEVDRFADPHLWIDRSRRLRPSHGCRLRRWGEGVWGDGVWGGGVSESATPALLSLRIGNTVQVKDTPEAGSALDEQLCVERITHSFTSTDWTTELDLSPYFGAGPWFTIGDDALGLFDGNNKFAP